MNARLFLCCLVLAVFSWACRSEDEILWPADSSVTDGEDGREQSDSIEDSGQSSEQEADRDIGQDAGQDAGRDAGGDVGVNTDSDESLDGGAGDSAGDQQHVPHCIQVCDSPLDCATQYDPWDADNYDCKDGACEYLGCLSDEECQAVPGMESYVCAGDSLASVRVCVTSCSTASDCATALPAWDEDNYRCEDGACHYSGCNSDQECRAVQGMQSYVCTAQAQGGPDQCMPGCSTVEDCNMGSAAYDQDNYSCNEGLCVYTGCNSDQECQASMGDIPAECR